MAQTYKDTTVNQLVINKLNKTEYDNLPQVSDTELYLVEEPLDNVVTEGSTNPVQSGAVYEALQDIGGTINDGTTTFTKNNETIGTTSANQENNQTIALPNDVMMCKMLENKALASYANPITRFKYIEDHGWVDMDRSNIQYNEGTGEWTGTFVSLDITEGEYYYDMDNDTVFVADENSEMQDVTSTVVIQNDINKLYCDVDTNILYRYNGSNFVAIEDTSKAPNYPTFSIADTRENLLGNGESTTTLWGKVKKWFADLKAVAFSGNYNDLSNKPLSVENSKVKYTLSDGTTKLTLAQESDVKNIPIPFTKATSAIRANIQSGETVEQMSAKISNYIAGLNIVVLGISDYTRHLAIIDVTDWYNNNSQTNYDKYIIGTCNILRPIGIVDCASTMNICAIVNWNRDYKITYSKNSNYSVNIVKNNNRYYITISRPHNSAAFIYFNGVCSNILNPTLQFKDSDVTIIYQGTEY